MEFEESDIDQLAEDLIKDRALTTDDGRPRGWAPEPPSDELNEEKPGGDDWDSLG